MGPVKLIDGPLSSESDTPHDHHTGADIVFHGRVRSEEEGQPITALFYEAYTAMAEKELTNLAREAQKTFPIQDIAIHHRVGEVPAGEVSLRIVVHSRHRREGLQALEWVITAIKNRVPIWKWGVRPDGSHFPSHQKAC